MSTSQTGNIETLMVADITTRVREDFQRNLPIRRLGWTEESDAVLWLSGSGASLVVSHVLVVDGGYTTP